MEWEGYIWGIIRYPRRREGEKTGAESREGGDRNQTIKKGNDFSQKPDFATRSVNQMMHLASNVFTI